MRRRSLLILAIVLAALLLILVPPVVRRTLKGAAPETPPLRQPEPAINVPVEILGVTDGDTLTVSCRLVLRVRLLDCWAPELRRGTGAERERGRASKANLIRAAHGKAATLSVPLDAARRLDDVLSFGRVLGHVWVGDVDLSAHQVAAGHAYGTKGELREALK